MLSIKRPEAPSATTPPYDVLAREARRAMQGGAITSELDRAISECAREARRRSDPPEVFLVRMKSCVGAAVPALAIRDRDALVSRTVRHAIRAYYDRA